MSKPKLLTSQQVDEISKKSTDDLYPEFMSGEELDNLIFTLREAKRKADVVDKLERLHKRYTLVMSNDGKGWEIEYYAKITRNASLVEAVESIKEEPK